MVVGQDPAHTRMSRGVRSGVPLVDAGRRGLGPAARHTGERLVVVAYAASQFVDQTLLSVGGFVVSAQKLTAMMVLPLGAVLLRRILVPPQLLLLTLLTFLAMSAAEIKSGSVNPTLIATLIAITLNCFAIVVLVSALAPPDRNFLRLFAEVWILCSILTAVLAVGQLLGLIPLFGDAAASIEARETESGLVRGTGLKFDPNFAAMILVVGLVFCHYLWSGWRRSMGVVVLVLGTAATLSRMGMLLALLIIVLAAGPSVSLRRSPTRKLAGVSAAAAGVALVGFLSYQVFPPSVRLYVDERFEDLRAAFLSLVFGIQVPVASSSVNQGSGAERADLNAAALQVFEDNWLVGVGANQVPAAIGRLTGIELPAHSTYLETLAVGGALGLVVLVYYAGSLTALIRKASGRADELPVETLAMVRAVRLVILCIAAMALVLTLNYIAFFWLPMALALAVSSLASSGAAPGISRQARSGSP